MCLFKLAVSYAFETLQGGLSKKTLDGQKDRRSKKIQRNTSETS